MHKTITLPNIPFDLRPLGLEQCADQTPYYCTPEGAEIIGWAGVDGIHYCTIPQFGEMIFSVNPMDFGNCVHPIARNGEDLLRLLLSCGDMSVLEQCYAWDEEQFKAFLLDCPATPEQQAVLDAIGAELGLKPMDDAFHYIKHLQAGFDLSQIPYPEDYYDPEMNAAAPERPEPWAVWFDGGFWGKGAGRAGTELPVNGRFSWSSERWYVPAVYACSRGLVIDFCIEVAPERESAFLEKWRMAQYAQESLSRELQEKLDEENPLNVEFRPFVTVNGKALQTRGGCATVWIPADCLPDDVENSREARRVLTHYGLDETTAWVFHRSTFLWATAKKPVLKSIGLRLQRRQVELEGIRFRDPEPGARLRFAHPVSGREYTLTVLEYERQELTMQRREQEEYEFPTHLTAMTFTLEPELPDRSFRLRDCCPNDAPRRIPRDNAFAAAIGIIGGADGPTAICCSPGKQTSESLHAAYSSLHFAPQTTVEWKLLFREKPMEDVEVTLLGSRIKKSSFSIEK